MTSRRQMPPQNQSGLYAILIVAGLILAGVVGWLASSMFNRSEANRSGQDENRQVAIQSKDSSATGPESEGSKTSDVDSSKTSAKGESTLIRHEKFSDSAAKKESSDKRTESTINSKSSIDDLKTKRATPKLSDLTTYKKNPNREPIKLPGARKDTKRSMRQKEGKGLPERDQKDTTRSKETSSESSASATNQYSFPQQSTPVVFFQELIVDRNPEFGIEGIKSIAQKFKYRAISKFSVGPSDSNGFRKVFQKVVAANLISSDELSKKSITESVSKLVGKEFQFTLDRKQQLVEFKGEKEKPKSLDLKDLGGLKGLLGDGKTGEGFMVSSVMDLDGWKEMAQLTFLLPDDKKKKWSGQMEHDWGEIGRWVGETKFEKKSHSNGKLRIDYAHWMRYEPPAEGKGSLPFKLGEVAFKSDEAGGRLQFNTRKNRIESLVERFKVEGEISASLLGGATKLKMKEVQTFELYLHDKQPQ